MTPSENACTEARVAPGLQVAGWRLSIGIATQVAVARVPAIRTEQVADPMSDHKLSSDRVVELLRGVRFPGFPRDIVTLGLLESVQLEGDRIGIALRLPGGRTEVPAELVQDIEGALKPTDARIEIAVSQGAATSRDSSERASSQAPPSGGAPQGSTLEGVRAVLAVASAKGGVGKSTVATNLACALRRGRALHWAARRRRLRSEPAVHDGRPDPPDRGGRSPLSPGRAPRRPLHVDGLLPRRHLAGDLARADGGRAGAAVPRATASGASSTCSWSICRPAPATRSSRSRSRSV